MLAKLSIRMKLGILVAIGVLLTVAVGLMGVYGINRATDGLETVYLDRAVPLAQLGEIERRLLENRLSVAAALVTPDLRLIHEEMDAVERNIAAITSVWEEYMLTWMPPEEAQLAERFARDRAQFVEALEQAVSALRSQNIESAEQIVTNRLRPLYEPVGEGIAALVRLQVRIAEEEYQAAASRASFQLWTTVFMILGGLLLASFFGLLVGRNIVGPLDHAVDLANALAQGDLDKEVEITSKDELGRMLMAMKAMATKISGIVREVNSAADALASASEEVSATAQNLSQGASEQAASVEETTASVEQMSASIDQNNENARLTNDMAAKAAREASEGGEAVGKTVSAMKQIAEQISIIDEIAYQTNLLALNAAIEAARAGEHGKGFAVVAAEVRKLAERSQVAAQEIGEVAKGSVGLAEQAGQLLEAMVPSIQKTAELVQEISAASTEQASGVRQINDAMGQLNSTTQQAASSSEELASTSEEMSGQGQQLQQLMAFFRINSAAARVSADQGSARVQSPSRPSPDSSPRPVSAGRSGSVSALEAEAEFVRF
jgi:methyl-accepting chemotaxis protein